MKLYQALDSFIEWRGLKNRPRTIIGYQKNLVHFSVYMRNAEIPVEQITLQDCMDYLNLLRRLGYHENTMNKSAIALKMLFEYLERRGLTVVNADLIPIPKKTFAFPRVGTEEEYRQLLAAIPTTGCRRPGKPDSGRPAYYHIRNRAILMMLWDTGARNNEIGSLELDDIDLDRMSARIKTGKSRGTVPFREVFWRQETNEALGKWLDARDEFFKDIKMQNPNHVFVGIKGGHQNCQAVGRRLQVATISEILRKYSNKAGLLAPLNPHACRHHMGRELARKGANAYAISSLLGHSNVTSSYPYTMMFGKDREDMYREKIGH